MSMFPGAGAQVEYNEAGEPIGWDYPADSGAFWCGDCGFEHGGECRWPGEDNDEYEEDDDDQ